MQTTHTLRQRLLTAARTAADSLATFNRQGLRNPTRRRAAIGSLLLLAALLLLPVFTPGISALVGQAKKIGGELTHWAAAPTKMAEAKRDQLAARHKTELAERKESGLTIRPADAGAGSLANSGFFHPRFAPVESFALMAGPTCKAISGYVYEDLNDNGAKDAGEPAISGVTLNLYNANNVVVGTTSTDGSGFYSFTTDSTINTTPTTTTAQTFMISDTTTNWFRELAVNQFDPSLGMLTKVTFTAAGSLTSLIRFESLDAAPTTITSMVSGTIELRQPTGGTGQPPVGTPFLTTNIAQSAGSRMVTAFDGAIDFGGTSGFTPTTPVTGSASSMVMLTDPANDLSAYMGTGTVAVRADARATSTASGAGNLITQVNTTASATITVTYTYMPSNCLQLGKYTIKEAQPTPYLDGLDTPGPTNPGTPITGSRATDEIMVMLMGSDIPNNNFGELACSTFHTTLDAAVCANSTGNMVSVPYAGPNAVYTWTVTGGTITAGQGTTTITYTAGATGPITVAISVANSTCNGTLTDSDTVTVNPAPAANAGPDLALCQALQGATAFTVNGTATNGTPLWTVMGTTGGASATIGSPASASTGVNVTGSGTITLKLAVTSNTVPACGVAEDTVVLTVNPNPVAVAGNNQTLCQTLPGPTAFNLSGIISGGTPAWTVSGTTGGATATIGSPTSASTGVNVTGTGTVTLKLTVTSGFTPSCGMAMSEVTLMVNPQATANAGVDQTLCQTIPGPTVFTVDGTATNGTPAWTVIGMTGTASATFGSAGSEDTTVNVTGMGTVTIQLAVTNGNSCNASDTAVLTVNPSPQAAAGNNQQACQTVPGPTAFTLNGTVAGGTPVWTVSGSTGGATATIGSPTSATTGVNIMGTGTVTLKLTVTSNQSPSCGMVISEVTLSVTPSPTADAGLDQTLCQTNGGTTAFTLNGTATNGTPAWTVMGMTGTAVANIVTPGSLTSTVNVTGLGTVTLKLTTTSNTVPTCGTASDTVTLAVNTNPTANAGTDQTLCQTLPGPTAFTLAGSATFGTPAWSVQGTTGGASATINTPGSLTSTVAVTGMGTVTLRLTVTSNATPGCGTATDDVVLIVNPKATTDAGPDQTLCQAASGPTVFTLAGMATNGTPAWMVSGSTGSASATVNTPGSLTSTVNVTGTGTVTLTLSATNNNQCNASDTVVLTVNPNPTANAGTAQMLCQAASGPTSFTLNGTATNGTPAWSVMSATGTAAATIVTPASLTSGVNVTGLGTVTLKLTTTSGFMPSCGTATSTVVLTVNPNPTADAGVDQTLCQAGTGPTVFTLSGAVTNGNPAWTVMGTTGTAAATVVTPASLTSTVNVTGLGTVTLKLTATSNQTPSCGTASDTVTLSVNTNPTADAGTAQTLCQTVPGPTVFNINATATNGASGWTVMGTTGGAAATISSPNTEDTAVNITGTGTVTLKLTVTSNATPSCGTATSTVVLTVNPNPTANAGTAQTLCQAASGPTAFTINGTVTNGTPGWTVVSATGSAGASILSPTTVSSGVNVTGVGTVTLKLTATSNQTPSCGTASSMVVLTVNPNPTVDAGNDQMLCQAASGPTAFTLNGTATNGTPAWTVMNSTGTAAATIVTPASLTSAVNVTGTGTVTLKLTATSNQTPACGTASDTVVVTVNPNPTANAGSDQSLCQTVPGPTVFNLNGTATNGTPTWMVMSATGTAAATIVTPASLTSAVNVTGTGMVTLKLTTTSNQTPSCGAASATVVLTVNPNPTANAGNAQTLCQTVPGPTVFSLNGTATNGTPAWSVQSTTGTAAATVVTPASLTSAVNVTGVGTVTMRLTTTSGFTPSCGTANSTVVLTVNPNPTANAGVDQTICQLGGPPIVFTLAGAVTNGTGAWSVSGSTGTAVANILTPSSLTSSVNVTGVGTVTLLLTVTSNQQPACTAVTDEVVLTASQAASVNAGVDQNVSACAASVQLAGVIGGAATSATWSGGQGSFSPNATTLNAVYTPSAAEKAAGATVTLTLTTNDPPGVCSTASDTVAIKLVPCANVNPVVVIIDPGVCIEPGTVLDIRATLTNTGTAVQGDNSGPEFTSNLPSQLLALAGSCTSSVGVCQVANSGQVNWNGSIPIGQSVTITFRAQVSGTAAPGTEFCFTSTAFYDYDNNGTNESSRTSAPACARATCPPAGPGETFQPTSEINDQKAGSILIYNIYTSSTSTPIAQNTRLSLTNTDLSRDVAVHLFFVDGATCSVADAFICLTRGQTTSLLASDFDPDTTGYVLAIATDLLGCPISFNHLIGDEFVKFGSGHAANLGAEAVSAVPGQLTACDGNSSQAVINFDGRAYNALPRVLAASSIPSVADGNETLLILNRIGGDLGVGAARLVDIFGILYNDQEAGYSFSFNPGSCQFRSLLSNSVPRTVPRFGNVIPAGRTGWFRLYSTQDHAILGSIINRNVNAVGAGAFNQGRNLHKLRLTTGTSVTIPVFPPVCR